MKINHGHIMPPTERLSFNEAQAKGFIVAEFAPTLKILFMMSLPADAGTPRNQCSGLDTLTLQAKIEAAKNVIRPVRSCALKLLMSP